jgi:hypothetical protein
LIPSLYVDLTFFAVIIVARDLTFINDGNEERLPMPQKPDVKLPNFEKMVLLGQQILELEAYRKVRAPLPRDDPYLGAGVAKRGGGEEMKISHPLPQQVPYTLDGDSSVATALRNAMYFDEDTLHRLSLEQEPIQNMEPEVDYLNDDETSNEKKTKNPLLALQQMREELLAESNEFDFSEGSENWAHDEDKTDDGTASKLEDKSE